MFDNGARCILLVGIRSNDPRYAGGGAPCDIVLPKHLLSETPGPLILQKEGLPGGIS